MYNYPLSVYMLVLGNLNKVDSSIDTKSVSNNRDVEKILATVARIILDFTDMFRNAVVYFKGTGAARNRLYKISINRCLIEIEKTVFIYEYDEVNKKAILFRGDADCSCFVISRKALPEEYLEYLILEESNEIYMSSFQKSKEKQKRVYDDRVIDGPELVDENCPAVREKVEACRKALDGLGFLYLEELEDQEETQSNP